MAVEGVAFIFHGIDDVVAGADDTGRERRGGRRRGSISVLLEDHHHGSCISHSQSPVYFWSCFLRKTPCRNIGDGRGWGSGRFRGRSGPGIFLRLKSGEDVNLKVLDYCQRILLNVLTSDKALGMLNTTHPERLDFFGKTAHQSGFFMSSVPFAKPPLDFASQFKRLSDRCLDSDKSELGDAYADDKLLSTKKLSTAFSWRGSGLLSHSGRG